MRIYKHPEALVSTLVSLPNGHRASEAILRVCKPNGIPIIVIISIILPIKYSIAITMPPKISQIRFPKIFIGGYGFSGYSRITVLSFGYFTE